MGLPEAVAALLSALGLGGAAGLNAWLPLLATGLAARWGIVDLGDPYDTLATTPALLVIGAGFALDFVGDKVPAVDSVLHAIGTVAAPVAGALVAAGQSGADLPEIVALAAGAVVAGGVHLGRAGVRPASTLATAGTGNPILSLLEDAGSLVLVVLALALPLLGALLVVALAVVLVRALGRVRRLAAPDTRG